MKQKAPHDHKGTITISISVSVAFETCGPVDKGQASRVVQVINRQMTEGFEDFMDAAMDALDEAMVTRQPLT